MSMGCFLMGTGSGFAVDGGVSGNPMEVKWGFLENQGQWGEEVLFRGRGSGFELKFERDGVYFMSAREIEEEDGHDEGSDFGEIDEVYEFYVWKMLFEGGKKPEKIETGKLVAARTNFFVGNDPEKWKTKVPEYDEVIYREVWKGIDVRFFLEPNGTLKYEFLLAPGADHEKIRIRFEGIDGLEIDPKGQLQLQHPWGPVTEEVPTAFAGTQNRDVPVQFRQTGPAAYGFTVASPPRDESWVIDPLMQYWSSFTPVTGTGGLNYADDVTHDQYGALYMTGVCTNQFPATTGAFQTTFGTGGEDAYVTKFSPDGTNLEFMTYLGGNQSDRGYSITVSDSGRVFVCGKSNSPNFPVSPGAMSGYQPPSSSPWVVSLSSDGATLHYSTFFDVNLAGDARSIVHVSNGDVVVAGYSTQGTSFPATPGALMPLNPGGPLTGWVCRLNSTGTGLVWGTHLGGNGIDYLYDVAVNDLEEPYVVGRSTSQNYPTTPGAISSTLLSTTTCLITRLNATGSALVYSTFLQFTGDLRAVGVNPVTRDAYITGIYNSGTIATTPGAYQPLSNGGPEGIVARINATGSAYGYVTFLGGSGLEFMRGIAVNSDGEAYASGFTSSIDFPVSACQLQTANQGSFETFIAHFSPDGTTLGEAGIALFGGSQSDYYNPRVEVRDDGNQDTLFMCLTTHSADFPTTPGSFQPNKSNALGDTPLPMKLVPVNLEVPDTFGCAIDSVEVRVPDHFSNVLWSTNDTTQSTWLNQPGQYWVTATLYNCTYTDTFNIGFNTLNFSLGPDTTVCSGGPISIALSPGIGTSWLWSNAATTAGITATSPGTYWVTVTDSVTGCTGTDTLIVQQNASPMVNLTAPLGCPGLPVILDADSANNFPGATYLWSNNATGQQTVYPPGALAWVDLTYGGCTARDSILLSQHPPAMVNLGPDTVVCNAFVFNADAGPGYTSYLWSTLDTTQVAAFNLPGVYWVIATDTNGCVASDSIEVFFSQPPPVNLGPDQTLCAGSPVALDADQWNLFPGATFLWHNNATTSQIIDSTSSGWFWAQVTTPVGCVLRDSVLINRLPQPLIELGPDTVLCNIGVFAAAVTPGYASYLWSNGATSATTTFSQSGLIHVLVTDSNGCSTRDSMQVSFVTEAPLNLGPDPILCAGGSISLDADSANQYPGASFLWHNGATTSQTTVNTSGWAWAEVITTDGCVLRDSLWIAVNPPPAVDLGADTTLCPGETLSLTAGAGYAGYLWSDGSLGPATAFSQAGTIWVEVTDSVGCQNRDSLLLSFDPTVAPNLGPDQAVCPGSSVSLDANPGNQNPGATYLWHNGATTSQVTLQAGGWVWVDQTSINNCVVRDSLLITLDPLPDPDLPADTLVCDQDSIYLYPGAYQSYLWSDGSTGDSLLVRTFGEYAVTVSGGGCLDSARIQVDFGQSPVTDLGPDLDLCLEDRRTLFLTPQSGFTVLWSDGSTGWSMDFPETGDYWAELTNECGTTRDSIQVNFAQELVEPFIPNVFTPNGDGISDCFQIENPDVQSFLMQIFDRWGRLMYETQNINDCWNGQYRNQPAPGGAYVCIVRLRACNGELLTRSEMVTLMR